MIANGKDDRRAAWLVMVKQATEVSCVIADLEVERLQKKKELENEKKLKAAAKAKKKQEKLAKEKEYAARAREKNVQVIRAQLKRKE